MEGVLPPEIQWRSTKGDLSSNFRRRLLKGDEATVERTDLSVLAPYVDVQRLRERVARYRESGGEAVSDADGCLVFRTTVLARWLSELHDEPPAPMARDAHDPLAPVAA
jgi:asparagine synthase (glutamine-hydrolysing)